MSRPTITIHDVETNEVVVREMNDAEFAQYEIDEQKRASRSAAVEAYKLQQEALKESAAAKLAALGLTLEEIQAIR